MKLTQEMVEAGAAAFLDALSDDVCAEVAARLIWRAMAEAKTAGDDEHYGVTFAKMNDATNRA